MYGENVRFALLLLEKNSKKPLRMNGFLKQVKPTLDMVYVTPNGTTEFGWQAP